MPPAWAGQATGKLVLAAMSDAVEISSLAIRVATAVATASRVRLPVLKSDRKVAPPAAVVGRSDSSASAADAAFEATRDARAESAAAAANDELPVLGRVQLRSARMSPPANPRQGFGLQDGRRSCGATGRA